MCHQQEDDTSSLSLLDLTVRIKANGEPAFDFYTKAAKSKKNEIFLHKQSALPWSQKTAAIRNELKRIETRSGTNASSNKAAFVKKLHSNGYQEEDIKACTRSRRHRPNRSRTGEAVHYIHLPFLGESAEHKIRRAFLKEDVNIRIVRKSTTLLDIVRPKQPEVRRCRWDSCPTKEAGACFTKNCVYEVTCLPCGRRYVGSTVRPIHERIREHTTSGRGSCIHEHLTACGGGMARVSVKIVAREKDAINTRIREAIIIKKNSPDLNTQEDSELVDLVA